MQPYCHVRNKKVPQTPIKTLLIPINQAFSCAYHSPSIYL